MPQIPRITTARLLLREFQSTDFDHVPPAHLYHSLVALERAGQDFTARMIAAEALSRT